MNFSEIVQSDELQDERKYIKNYPSEMALVVVYEDKVLPLCHIGAGMDYISDVGLLEEYLENDLCPGLAGGVYIWEGKLITHRMQSEYGDDYDDELVGEFRLATKDEWESHLNGDWPWDQALWFEKELKNDI